MVEFLEEVKGTEFVFEKGKRYVSKKAKRYISQNDVEDVILIRQPNSPKKKNWWARFPQNKENVLFKTIEEKEMTITEKKKEYECFQY